MTDIRIGDYVEITEDMEGDLIGQRGVVSRLDAYDRSLPYRVEVPGRESAVWVHAVRKAIDPTPTREAAVTRAKELLSDTAHSGADVIRLAEFLAAGE